jgi:hypothetical protein
MKIRCLGFRALLAVLAGGLALASGASAETIAVGEEIALKQSAVERPSRGMSMTSVEQRFGAPAARHNAVGQPPISRWDYPGFSVFFEREYVIHAVATTS